jgi:hypothetical protein
MAQWEVALSSISQVRKTEAKRSFPGTNTDKVVGLKAVLRLFVPKACVVPTRSVKTVYK